MTFARPSAGAGGAHRLDLHALGLTQGAHRLEARVWACSGAPAAARASADGACTATVVLPSSTFRGAGVALTKKGRKFPFSWKERRFIVSQAAVVAGAPQVTLAYYQHAPSPGASPKGSMLLRPLPRVSAAPAKGAALAIDAPGPPQRTLQLRCESVERQVEVVAMVGALVAACAAADDLVHVDTA